MSEGAGGADNVAPADLSSDLPVPIVHARPTSSTSQGSLPSEKPPTRKVVPVVSAYKVPEKQEKPPRWVISEVAKARLEGVYALHKFPTLMMREQLSAELGGSQRQVQVWFQNRRQRDHRFNSNAMMGAWGSWGQSQWFTPGGAASAAPMDAPNFGMHSQHPGGGPPPQGQGQYSLTPMPHAFPQGAPGYPPGPHGHPTGPPDYPTGPPGYPPGPPGYPTGPPGYPTSPFGYPTDTRPPFSPLHPPPDAAMGQRSELHSQIANAPQYAQHPPEYPPGGHGMPAAYSGEGGGVPPYPPPSGGPTNMSPHVSPHMTPPTPSSHNRMMGAAAVPTTHATYHTGHHQAGAQHHYSCGPNAAVPAVVNSASAAVVAAEAASARTAAAVAAAGGSVDDHAQHLASVAAAGAEASVQAYLSSLQHSRSHPGSHPASQQPSPQQVAPSVLPPGMHPRPAPHVAAAGGVLPQEAVQLQGFMQVMPPHAGVHHPDPRPSFGGGGKVPEQRPLSPGQHPQARGVMPPDHALRPPSVWEDYPAVGGKCPAVGDTRQQAHTGGLSCLLAASAAATAPQEASSRPFGPATGMPLPATAPYSDLALVRGMSDVSSSYPDTPGFTPPLQGAASAHAPTHGAVGSFAAHGWMKDTRAAKRPSSSQMHAASDEASTKRASLP